MIKSSRLPPDYLAIEDVGNDPENQMDWVRRFGGRKVLSR
jgi:hypothetical protein